MTLLRATTAGVGTGVGTGGWDGKGSGCEAMLLLDKDEGGRQLPKIASRKADAVGDGMEYSDTETDNDGRSEGRDSVIDGRAPFWSTSVSIGVLNDMLSLEYRDSLAVRDRLVENEGIPERSLESGEMPRLLPWYSGRGGGDSDIVARW